MGGRNYAARLGLDVWHLILQHVSDRNDLANLCRACKNLNTFATPFLYRTITIGPSLLDDYTANLRYLGDEKYKSEAQKWFESLAFVCRLTAHPDESCRVQTRAIREIDIGSMQYGWVYQDGDSEFVSDDENEATSDYFDDEKPNRLAPKFEQELPGLISALPNLHRVRIFSTIPAFEALFRALAEHPNKPEIHLLNEDGHRIVSGPMPGVVTIKATANFWYSSDEPNPEIPNMEKLFFACPDLRTFSLSVPNNWGGCVRPSIRRDTIMNFQFALGNGVRFPPLESLSLSGYRLEDEEWPHWRDGLDWSSLRALELGPDPMSGMYRSWPTMDALLSRVQDHAAALRSLSVQTWQDEGNETCPPLISFLRSFDTLEELTVKRHFVPVDALFNHRKLKHLCVHCIETERPEGSSRPTFGIKELALLDKTCPDLQTLEIDVSRDASGAWSRELIEILASSFLSLRHLILHCEVGLVFDFSRQDAPLLPVLDEGLVRAFAEPFFASRGRSGMEKLTLKTGEKLRRFSQQHPGYRHLEEQLTREFDTWMQISDGEVKVERCHSREFDSRNL